MNKKYDDSFFEDLDKTTDLLKSFKPRVSNNVDSSEQLSRSEFLEQKISQRDSKKKEEVPSRVSRIDYSQLQEKKVDKEKKKQPSQENVNEIMKRIDAQKRQKDAQLIEEKKAKLKKEKMLQAKKNAQKKPKDESTTSEVMPRKGKRRLKKGVGELIFCALSIIFILGCCIFYGQRLIKYYRIYNPKSETGENLMLLSTAIAKDSSLVYEGDGLYMQGGEYIYKGSKTNNYVMFSNLLWRIIKSNNDGSIDLILDDYINSLSWDTELKDYTKSDISDYLNSYFIKYLDKDYLTTTTVCKDKVTDLQKFSCNKKDNKLLVRLPSVSDFLNSKVNDTYMSDKDMVLWLNTISDQAVWQINGNNLSLAEPTRALGIKPVIKLKSGVALLSGKGTKEDPYIIDKDKELQVGDYVTLGNDRYVIYDTNKNELSLALDKFIDVTYRYDVNSNIYNPNSNVSLAYYLNNTYLNTLTYKDMLIEKEWNTGTYTSSYKDINGSVVKAKVGLLDMANLKFDNELQDYFLLNGVASNIYLYGNEMVNSKPAISRHVRPTICIKTAKIKDGTGTKENPYVLEG